MSMKRSVITDEVSQRLSECARFARAHDLTAVELRSVENMGAFEWTDELVRRMKSVFQSEGLSVCALSLPFYKCAAGDAGARAQQMDHLRRALQHAKELGAPVVRGFCFWREGAEADPRRVADAFEPVKPLLEDADISMALESDPSVNGHNARALLAILEAVDSPRVGALLDAGNLLFSPDGEDALDALAMLYPRTVHVHIKDAVRSPEGARAVCVGQGEARVGEQLRLLCQKGYAGYLSLETHYRLCGEISEEEMRLPGGEAFSRGGWPASDESMRALRALVQEALATC